MSLPEQIQKQVDEAKRIVEEHYGTGEEQGSPEEVASSSGAPDQQSASVDSRQETPPAPSGGAEDGNSATYEQRWRSQQGIVASLNNQLAGATQRITSLESVIAMMQSAPPAPQPQAPRGQESFITDRDREEYGEEMLDFTTRVARQEAAELREELAEARQMIQQMGQQFQTLQSQVVPTVQRVAHNQQRTAEQEFFTALAGVVPNWERVNSDRRFHEWLLSQDAMTGITRQVYLADAQKNLDVRRVASIFNSYLGSTGSQPQAVSRKAPTDELQNQIAPGRTLSAPAPSANEARKWTRAEITQLYEDKTHGKFVGREAEFTALERDIFKAQSDGRIAA